MKMRKFIKICLIGVLSGVLCGVCLAQQGVVTLSNDVAVAIRTETTPAVTSSENSYGNIYSSSSKNIIHRIMTDRQNKIYFGYDLSVERQADTGKFKVSIKPLSKEPDKLVEKIGTTSSGSGSNSAKATSGAVTSVRSVGTTGTGEVKIISAPNYKDYIAQPLPNYPDDVIVDDGDTITLDLLENPATNTKIADVITVMSQTSRSGVVFSTNKAVRSFSIDDVYLKMETPDIYINEKKYQTNSSVAGNISWIYIKGKGRFIFSFKRQPNYNFQQNGVIQDNEITFNFNGDEYRIVSRSPVLGQGGKWNLWIMHDASYQPTNEVPDDSPFIFGAAGKVNYLFERK